MSAIFINIIRRAAFCFSAFSPLAFAATPPAAPVASAIAEAHQLIDQAVQNRRALPGFVTTSVKEHGRGVEKIVRYVRNTGTPAQLIREERTIELPRVPPRKTVFIQNHDGFWQLRDGVSLRMMFPMLLDRPIPSRMPVAQRLCVLNNLPYDESRYLTCSIARDVDFFGLPCTRITLGLSADSLALVAKAAKQPSAGSLATDESGTPAATGETPGSFVYYISKATPFILAWQAYSTSGRKMSDVSFQEFQTQDYLPDTLFSLPSENRIVAIADRAAYNEFLKSTRPPVSATKK